MTVMSQKEKAALFRSLHTGQPMLVLPNAWDAASARVLEQAGFQAIATTSSGLAAALGYADGEQISRDMLVEAVERITRVVTCPVSVDIEAGFGDGIDAVLQTISAVIATGAVGINIEDSTKRGEEKLVDVSFQVELLKAIEDTALTMDVPVVINARTDVFLLNIGDPASRVEEAVRRLNAYRQAGADCLFPILVNDAATIAALAHAVNGPINILASPATPTIPELARMGVARVSFGGGLLRAALGHLQTVARELLEQGTYTTMAGEMFSSQAFRELFKK